jgi:DUF1680 family protein
VGSRYVGEGFGEAYELPNDRCHCETCAQIASVMWNWRMLLATGEACFADLIERTLFNGVLSGVTLDGGRFFYVNPLMVRGTPFVVATPGALERQDWFKVPCCPTNMPRTLATVSHYFATTNVRGVQIHQFSSMRIDTILQDSQKVALDVETDYPWDGDIHIVIRESGSESWSLSLRVPSWCASFAFTLNGKPIEPDRVDKGYAVFERSWRTGDQIRATYPMVARLTEAHHRVDALRGCVAIERGPIVYCLEDTDQPEGTSVLDVEIDTSSPLEETWRGELLEGVMTIQAQGYVLDTSSLEGSLYQSLGQRRAQRHRIELTAVPYYAWANREAVAMKVWIPMAR